MAAEGTHLLRALATRQVIDTMPEERFDRITRLARRALSVSHSFLVLAERGGSGLKSRQGFRADGEDENWIDLAERLADAGGAAVVGNAATDARFRNHPLVRTGVRIRYAAALRLLGPDGSGVGILCAADPVARDPGTEDSAVLKDLAAMVEREIVLIESATTDDLTHLANRRGFTLVAQRTLDQCRRQCTAATVVGIDLDRFKYVNDVHGHEAGDAVLKSFAKLLVSHFRQSDVIARLGGDEFAVLCTGSPINQIDGSIARLGEGFTKSRIAAMYPDLSWSAGLADYDPMSSATIEDLLRTSDARMYRTKYLKARP